MTSPAAEQYLAENGRTLSARTAQQTDWRETAAKGVDGAQGAIEAALKRPPLR